jgi:hypothetical protein
VGTRAAAPTPHVVDIMAFIKDNPAPTTIILISGDRDFAYLLSTIRWRKYNVVLITNSSMTHESLTAPASLVYDWKSDVLKTRPVSKPLSHRSRREASSSAALLTTAARESDNSSGSEVHPADLPKEHTAPTIQPLALPPRSVGIDNTSTILPIHAAPPPGAPLVGSEATPMLPKKKIPAGPAPSSISMIPTPDDRIVADLTSDFTMVHLVIVHSVVTDLGLQQDQSSPEANKPVGEGGAYSLAFVSTHANVTPTQPSSPEFSEFSGDDSTRGWRWHPLLS